MEDLARGLGAASFRHYSVHVGIHVWFLTAGKAVLSAITGFLGALAKWAGYFFAYRLGRSKERTQALGRTKEIQDEQLEILARPDKHRSDLIDDSLRRERDD